MAATEVILIENIPGLGAEADLVKVKNGYARNFLIPSGKACEVTPTALKRLNQLKAKRAEREARELNEAQELARKIGKARMTITIETGETGKAFGSITAKDIADQLKAELGGIEIERHKIALERPIKDTGDHEISIKLHHDVSATLNLHVKAKAEVAAAKKEEETAEKPFKAKPKARHTK
jgi:large subunit ribosomal protein L9